MRRYLIATLFAVLLAPSGWGDDVLTLAAQGMKHEELRAALKALPGSVNDVRDSRQRTALHLSVARRQYEDVLLLLLAGADPNAVDADGQTPLFNAVVLWREDALLMVELLVLAGAGINRADSEGMTVLAMAAGYGSPEVVDFLLRRGAALEPAGVPPMRWPMATARACDNARALAVLEAARSAPAPAPPSTDPPATRFLKATRAADLETVRALLKSGVDINERDGDGATALYRAISDHRPDLVTLLLLEGANPNIANHKGFSPLMAATPFFDLGGTRAFLLLMLAGADLKYVSAEGRTALTEAVFRRNILAAKWCVWHGADLQAKAPEGTIMQLAKAQSGWPAMIELLKNFGGEDDGSSAAKPEDALFDAVRAGDVNAVKAALGRGIPVDVVDSKGCPPLSWAVHYGKFEIVDLLVQNGADVNQRNSKTSKTTFQEMALWGRAVGSAPMAAKYMEELLKRGADANLLTKDGQNALMVAARTGTSGENLKVLLRVTTDLNLRNKEGRTALGIAREFGFSEVAQLLVERGAVE